MAPKSGFLARENLTRFKPGCSMRTDAERAEDYEHERRNSTVDPSLHRVCVRLDDDPVQMALPNAITK